MKKLLFLLGLLLIVSVGEAGEALILENQYLRIAVDAVGGRISSMYDKQVQKELLDQYNCRSQGAGKTRENLYRGLEMLTRRFKLVRVDSFQVRASVVFARGVVKDMLLVRTFTLLPDRASVRIDEIWKSQTVPNQLLLNWHNKLSLAKNMDFLLPVEDGMVRLSAGQALRNQMNLVEKMSTPFLAAVDYDKESGISLYMRQPRQIQNMYIWADTDSYTLEANFQEARLRPVAAADEVKYSGSLSAWRARGKVLAIAPEAVLSKADNLNYISFIVNPGKCQINGLPYDGEVGKLIPVPESPVYHVVTPSGEFTLKPAREQNAKKISTRLPPRRDTGVHGFYYYYPELFLSDEIITEIGFGLRGDFSNRKNFRLRLHLPRGVNLVRTRRILARKGQVVDLYSYRRTTCSVDAVSADIKLTGDFQSENSTMLVQAVWDGGEQPPEKVQIRKIAPLPQLGKLKHFELSFGDIYSPEITVPDYARYGISWVIQAVWRVEDSIENYYGDDYYRPMLSQMAKGGLSCARDLGCSFAQRDNVFRNKYQKELGTFFHPVKKYAPIHSKEFQAWDYSGKPVNLVCPAYRGRYFEKTLDMLKSAIDYGYDHIVYDEETWSRGGTICYCPRCRPHSADEDLFWKWKTDQVADIYRRIRELMDTYHVREGRRRRLSVWLDAGVSEKGRYNAIQQRLTDYRKIGMYADDIMPMAYTEDSAAVGQIAHTASRLLKGTRASLTMGLSPNRTYEYFRIQSQELASPEVEIEQILEAFFNGARGVTFWNHRGTFRGARSCLNLIRAVNLIQPVEMIVLKGKPIDIPTSNVHVKVTAFQYQGKIALFARNYDSAIVRTTLTLPSGKRNLIFNQSRYCVIAE